MADRLKVKPRGQNPPHHCCENWPGANSLGERRNHRLAIFSGAIYKAFEQKVSSQTASKTPKFAYLILICLRVCQCKDFAKLLIQTVQVVANNLNVVHDYNYNT